MLPELWDTLNQPLFWLAISIFYFWLGEQLQKRVHTPVCNPLLITVILLGVTMYLTGTSLDTYNGGGRLFTLFLTPITVSLAVPIYRKLDVLKKNLLPVLAGALAGSVTALVSVFLLCHLFGLDASVTRSLLPKSVTTPIGIRISEQLGGIPSLTAVCIILTGMSGAIILPSVLKFLHLDTPVAAGVAMGTSAHAFGTARAVQMGETEGAMASLSLGMAGILTALIASVLGLFW